MTPATRRIRPPPQRTPRGPRAVHRRCSMFRASTRRAFSEWVATTESRGDYDMNDIDDVSVNEQLKTRLQRLEAAECERKATNRRLRRLGGVAMVAGAFVLPAVATAI